MNGQIDPYILQHLAQFLVRYVRDDHHEAFSAYALSRIAEDPDYWLNQEWSKLYGQFLFKN